MYPGEILFNSARTSEGEGLWARRHSASYLTSFREKAYRTGTAPVGVKGHGCPQTEGAVL